jgi:transcriptional regulator with GAF, ATPase, and Fis domain
VRQFEVNLIRTALGRTSGSQIRAARLLGLKPTTLNAKIKRYNIAPTYQPQA